MGKIDELIQQYCPDGVEFDTLGNLGVFYGGITGKSKADFTNGNAKFISYMNVYSNPSVDQNTEDAVKIGKDEKQRTLQYCDVCFTGSSETPDECGFASVVTEHPTESLYLNSFCFFFRFNEPERFNPHFLKHLFRDHDLRYQIGKTANGVTRFNVSKELMKSVEIPVPPLPVQDGIVRILNAYTQLESELKTELETELEMRQKQYEYYRGELLKFEGRDDVDWIPLGELFTFKNGINKEKSAFGHGNPIVNYTDVYHNCKINSFTIKGLVAANDSELERFGTDIGDVFFTRTSETKDEVGYAAVMMEKIENCIFSGFLIKGHPITDKLLPEYCAYCFASNTFRHTLISRANMTTRATITGPILSSIEIPVPRDKKEQKWIADNLDRLSTLIKNLSEDLPAEIKMRHQQYEFYRDQLLTFKRLEDKAV